MERNRGPDYAPLLDEDGLYLLGGRFSGPPPGAPMTGQSDDGSSPRVAPQNAESDFVIYADQARLYSRRAKRFAWLSIGIAVLTTATGAFTVVADDQAALGIATGLLGALAVGTEGLRNHNKDAQKAAAYRSGYVDIEIALRAYSNPAAPIAEGSAEDALRKADLTARLADINRATESQLH